MNEEDIKIAGIIHSFLKFLDSYFKIKINYKLKETESSQQNMTSVINNIKNVLKVLHVDNIDWGQILDNPFDHIDTFKNLLIQFHREIKQVIKNIVKNLAI